MTGPRDQKALVLLRAKAAITRFLPKVGTEQRDAQRMVEVRDAATNKPVVGQGAEAASMHSSLR
eukprot:1161757-Pelagomonas_calceolata.AAC.1